MAEWYIPIAERPRLAVGSRHRYRFGDLGAEQYVTVYPIHVNRHPYGGSVPAKRRKASEYNAVAHRLEDYLNRAIEANPEPIQQFLYSSIAREISIDVTLVRRVLFSVDCGHNGLTVARSSDALREFLTGHDAMSDVDGDTEQPDGGW